MKYALEWSADGVARERHWFRKGAETLQYFYLDRRLGGNRGYELYQMPLLAPDKGFTRRVVFAEPYSRPRSYLFMLTQAMIKQPPRNALRRRRTKERSEFAVEFSPRQTFPLPFTGDVKHQGEVWFDQETGHPSEALVHWKPPVESGSKEEFVHVSFEFDLSESRDWMTSQEGIGEITKEEIQFGSMVFDGVPAPGDLRLFRNEKLLLDGSNFEMTNRRRRKLLVLSEVAQGRLKTVREGDVLRFETKGKPPEIAQLRTNAAQIVLSVSLRDELSSE